MNEEIKPADDTLAVHEDYAGAPADELHVTAHEPSPQTALSPVPHRLPVAHKPVRKFAGRKVVTTLTLSSRTCKWPIGDPTQPDFHYCGQPPQSGRPYCDSHDRMSYQPVQRRRPS